ncbi:DEKNAAC104647 [Brettanomyces naardenensis]|uniref:DEKNAAC104647 n=1 Tax=Brettanomyces naardenensis TaxID=13370 RepID=A0A448YRI0_BRENA|nr:DEKNAAC104647 [Brettanomyces naardenensis]
MTLNVAIVGTGIFARDAHLPALEKSEYFTPYSCFNRTKPKAVTFAKNAKISKIYDNMEEAFEDPKVDIVDALLPVQFNLDAVKLAVKHKKNICLEKPIAANLEQAEQIVKLYRENPDILIAINEHWLYFKAVNALKDAISKIGKVYSFTYHSTGPFHFDNKYLVTSWRQKPQHIGGYLSDGGVHQLALLTGVLGNVKKVNAHTNQIRKLSGTDDILYSLFELESGVIGTYTYGSVFGNTDKKCFFMIMGDNGTIYLDFSPSQPEKITLRVGGASPDSETYTKEIVIEDENRTPLTEFNVLGEALTNGDNSVILATPEATFHHLAIVDAALKSSAQGGATVEVQKA